MNEGDINVYSMKIKQALDEGNSSDEENVFSLENLIKHFSLEFHMKLKWFHGVSIDIGLSQGIHGRTWLKYPYLYGDKTLRGKCTFTMP